MKRHAEISRCGRYRYLLERNWGPPLLQAEILVVCMLNPSTADAETDDATIRWLCGWAKKRTYTALRVVNLAAYRATSPRDLLAAFDPIGPENKSYLARYTSGKHVLCGWGAHGPKLARYYEMLKPLDLARRLHCLGTTKSGEPRHPLRLSHAIDLRPWGATALAESEEP
jgi:hypothetical protein